MNFCMNFPLFSIVLCLLCAVISSVLKGKAARILSMALCICVAVLSVCVCASGLSAGSATEYRMGHYPHPWGNELRFGILEPFFAAAFSLILLLCILGGKKQLERDLNPEKANLYYVMSDLVLVSLLALIYTNDLFTGYVFIEICTISACGLLMIRQFGRTTLASVRYMIFSLLGSGLFLLGVILLYGITGNLLIPSLHERISELYRSGSYHVALISSMALICIGLAIKSGLFPFHYWMPDTYGAATPASAAILSGLVSKGYIVLLIKVITEVFGTDVFEGTGVHNIFLILGILGMIIGSVSAIRETDIFRMTAFSSAAQIGYIYMGIGISTQAGLIAALFHILSHAITKPLVFLAAGQLSDASDGGSSFRSLTGAGHRNRLAGAAFTIGAFSMIGIPATIGFLSKYLFATAVFETSGFRIIVTLTALALSTVLNAVYFGKTVIRIYTPTETVLNRCTMRSQTAFAAAAIFLSAVNLYCGLFSNTILSLLEKGLKLL